MRRLGEICLSGLGYPARVRLSWAHFKQAFGVLEAGLDEVQQSAVTREALPGAHELLRLLKLLFLLL
jgi:hypothetical protein